MGVNSVPVETALPLIVNYESGGNNVPNYINDATHTASGYFQITNTTWDRYAPSAGIDTSQYPTAISAPYSAQAAVASQIYQNEGFSPWSNYDAPLANAIATQNYTVSPAVQTLTASNGTLNDDPNSSASGTIGPNMGAGVVGSALGSVAGGVNSAIGALSGGVNVVTEIATRSMVVVVGLVLLAVGLIWAMRSSLTSSGEAVVRSVQT